ncbi:MAG: flagellar basal body-associated FliL family protein [Clostridiales bacterium]|nr:flagellar basal body-associated FliL family protein [Clostridiales bacterium]
MKKNILAVIILAATLINLTLTAVLLFVFMPTVKKTNNLITKVAQIIDLELEDVVIKEETTDVGDVEGYKLSQDISLNLSVGKDGKAHLAKISGSVYLNKKADDYSKIKELMESYDDRIREVITDEVSKLTFEDFSNTEKKNETKNTILDRIQNEIFMSKCITSISFSQWIAQ